MTITETLALYNVGPAECPECGAWEKIYVRKGDELVCQECADGD